MDAAEGENEEDRLRFAKFAGRLPCIKIWNKTDAAEHPPPAGYIGLSTVTMDGFRELEEALAASAAGPGVSVSPEGGAVIDSLRQQELLKRAAESLRYAGEAVLDGMPLDMTAVELQDALHALGEITGEVSSADILDTIFSNFCVGK